MILGTQWYILFNVIAGASAFPGDLREAASNFRLGGWLWWRKVMLPGILPYYVTGAITASGGSWNASDRRRGRVLGRHQADGARASAPISPTRPKRGDYPARRARHRRDVGLRGCCSTACCGGRSTPSPSAACVSADEEIAHGHQPSTSRRLLEVAASAGRPIHKDSGDDLAGARRRRPRACARARSSALLGRSGSGKSTLLRIIAGLMTPTAGEVLWRGRPMHGPAEGVAMVFQTFALFPWLTVLENVELGLEARGIAARRARQARAGPRST